MTEQAASVTRITETRRRAAAVIREAGDPKVGPASTWAAANLKMQALAAEQMAATAMALEEIRDFIAAIRASLPLYAVEQP